MSNYVLIPLRIRSISTRERKLNGGDAFDCLNPFENQVYFHKGICRIRRRADGLNPFENQVYFHDSGRARMIARSPFLRLNPFENQVYFHVP